MNGKEYKGLIDTGCSRTVVSPKINVKPEAIIVHSRGKILSFDGQAVPHDGEADMAIEMAGQKVIVRAISVCQSPRRHGCHRRHGRPQPVCGDARSRSVECGCGGYKFSRAPHRRKRF